MLYADPDVAAARGRVRSASTCRWRSLPAPRRRAAAFAEALPVCRAGGPAAGGDAAIVAAIERGVAAVTGGAALALVTNPITKRSLDLANLPYPGHTEFLAELAVRSCAAGRGRGR